MKTVGTLYLLHFSNGLNHAFHYLGWADDLDARILEHQQGRGAKITQVAVRRGIEIKLVRTWKRKTRYDERALKNRHNARSLCPDCAAAYRESQLFYREMRKLDVRSIRRPAKRARRRSAFHNYELDFSIIKPGEFSARPEFSKGA